MLNMLETSLSNNFVIFIAYTFCLYFNQIFISAHVYVSTGVAELQTTENFLFISESCQIWCFWLYWSHTSQQMHKVVTTWSCLNVNPGNPMFVAEPSNDNVMLNLYTTSGYNIVTMLWQRHMYNATTTTSSKRTSDVYIVMWCCNTIVTVLYPDVVYRFTGGSIIMHFMDFYSCIPMVRWHN